ncbi:MAG: UvrD-helicase domain-containing protein [Bacteroidales bacterium]|nr:UvrD-helicase domain-containing protein [Bacteroidales bacterium]
MEADDALRQRIIEAHGGSTLVLGGPGCGKTHLLAHRIHYAHSALGVPYSDMLCLTFTNRAAREMRKRVEEYSGFRPEGLFVGNIHRFCLGFLLDNELIDRETGVLDEEDRNEFLRSLDIRNDIDADRFAEASVAIYQEDNNHPPFARSKENVHISAVDRARYDAYREFKEVNRLIDFDDILLETYSALLRFDHDLLRHSSYRWLQVDEVQDMTALQLAIVAELTKGADCTRMFFGDEQQAIFAFTGAGGSTLLPLKQLCRGNILHLTRNFRSSPILVDLCNSIATAWLGIDPELLPEAALLSHEDERPMLWKASAGNLRLLTAHTAREWLTAYPQEKVMILTRTNREADNVSALLDLTGIDHFHISKQDVFNRPEFKALWSHLAVLSRPDSISSWIRLIKQTGAASSLVESRRIVSEARNAGVSVCASVLGLEQPLTYFANAYFDPAVTLTVIDTETTGLDVFNDDVVQIAAVKIRGGVVEESSRLNIFVETDRDIPEYFSNGAINPIASQYRIADKLCPADALNILANYLADGSILAGHNIRFDSAILRYNFKRAGVDVPDCLGAEAPAIDSMQIAKLIFPRYKSYSLGSLIAIFHIDGHNTHIAGDDVAATAGLLNALAPLAQMKLNDVAALSADAEYLSVIERIKFSYGEYYRQCLKRLEEPSGDLASLLDDAYKFFVNRGFIKPLRHFNYIVDLIRRIYDDSMSLRMQLDHCLYDILTFHESDLFASGIVKERLSVMTVHKAKGLECDNVILHDASTRYGSMDEHARLLYVAFSRARKRLAAGLSGEADGVIYSFLYKFRELGRREIAVAVNCEALNLGETDEE